MSLLLDSPDAETFVARLRDNGLVDAVDERALEALADYLHDVQPRLFVDAAHFVDGWYVTDAPEWSRVRELAGLALQSLLRPKPEKGAASA